MKRILSIALLAMVVPSFLSAQGDEKAMQSAGGTEQEIRSVITQVREAQLKGDAAALDRFLADDYVFTNPLGEVMTKAQTVSDYRSGAIKFQSMKMDEVRVRLFGDTAVATGHLNLKGQRRGRDISGQYRATWVLVKNQGRWQPVAGQSTRIAEDTTMAGSDKPTTPNQRPRRKNDSSGNTG